MEALFDKFPGVRLLYSLIIEAYLTHNLNNPIITKTFKLRFSEDEIVYELIERSIKFPSKDFFKMRLIEKGKLINDFQEIELFKYTYHGQFVDNPEVDYIRFDFEPFMRKHAPLHVNANEKLWGDHLTFPDGTNLEIKKMNLMKALKVFSLYSQDRSSHPLDKSINEPYATIIKGD